MSNELNDDLNDIRGLPARQPAPLPAQYAAARAAAEFTATSSTPFTIAVGRKRYPVASLAEASAKFCAARDRSGFGASRIASPLLYDGAGNVVGHVSYNGRVWAGRPGEWKSGAVPAYDPAKV